MRHVAGVILEEAEPELELLWELQCIQGSEKGLVGWEPSIQEDGDAIDVSIICLSIGKTGLGHGNSAPGHHSPASRLLKHRVRSGNQRMARMP
jgi:hypothetical protein